jgi:acetolactate synthase regulatory subunit
MSAIAIAPATPAPTTARPRRLALETTVREDVLVRVLTLLRRRGCRIVALDFHEADRHGPGRLELAIEAPPRIEHALENWLLGLVDVIAVSSQ